MLCRAPRKTAVDPATGELYTDLTVITVPHFNGHDPVLVQQSRLGELDRDRDRLAKSCFDARPSSAS